MMMKQKKRKKKSLNNLRRRRRKQLLKLYGIGKLLMMLKQFGFDLKMRLKRKSIHYFTNQSQKIMKIL
jgi:hypothetical protein